MVFLDEWTTLSTAELKDIWGDTDFANALIDCIEQKEAKTPLNQEKTQDVENSLE